MEPWKIIQKHYPKEGKLRASGQESEEIVDDYQPICLFSKPGELRREYEEEISKVGTLFWKNSLLYFLYIYYFY